MQAVGYSSSKLHGRPSGVLYVSSTASEPNHCTLTTVTTPSGCTPRTGAARAKVLGRWSPVNGSPVIRRGGLPGCHRRKRPWLRWWKRHTPQR